MLNRVVVAIGYPTVVDQHAGEVFEHRHRVHHRGASARIEVIGRQLLGGDHVHPGQAGVDSQAGLVGVHHRCRAQLGLHFAEGPVEQPGPSATIAPVDTDAS